VSLKDVIGYEDAVTELFVVGFWKIAVSDACAAYSNLAC